MSKLISFVVGYLLYGLASFLDGANPEYKITIALLMISGTTLLLIPFLTLLLTERGGRDGKG